MKRSHAIATAILAGLGAVVVPILAALYLTHRQSLQEETRQALTIAQEVRRRADEAGSQSTDAVDQVLAAHDPEPCSDANIAIMRRIDMGASYIQFIGHVEGDRLVCSSIGRHEPGIAIGPPTYVSSLGNRVRPSVELAIAPGTRFFIAEKRGYVAIMHRDLAIDVFTDNREVSLGLFAISAGKPMIARGHFDPAWTKALRGRKDVTFFDGAYVVAIAPSKRYDYAAFAATPVSYLRARDREAALLMVPVGAGVGLLLLLSLGALARRRLSLRHELHTALRHHELLLHYQPIVALDTGQCVGAEALIRWRRPDGRFVRPDLFIPVAEESGLIRLVTARVIELLRQDAPAVLERFPGFRFSLNLSAADLHSDAIVATLRGLATAPGFTPRNLHVEITERCFIDLERAKANVRTIRDLGIEVAIDDFGTGFCSLSYLHTFQVDYLKIDKSFVETMDTGAASSQVATHIIEMAKSLNLAMIAEGVQTEEQAQFLRSRGVQYAQGWLYAKAMPVAELLHFPEPAPTSGSDGRTAPQA